MAHITQLDRAALNKIRALQNDGGAEILIKVVNLYLENSPKQLQAIQQSIAQGDAAKLRNAAHSLKSSSASLGATTLAALCKEIEEKGRNRQMHGLETTLSVLEFEYAAACRALSAEIKQRAA
jgi:HPt (histidine-containing phosphotransfer) domain-containing protein